MTQKIAGKSPKLQGITSPMQVTPSEGDRVDVPKRDFTREVRKREGGGNNTIRDDRKLKSSQLNSVEHSTTLRAFKS